MCHGQYPPGRDQISVFSLLIRRIFHFGKNCNRSNRFLLRFIAIYCDLCDFFLGNQIRHREKTEEDCKDLLPSMVSLLGTVESSK